MDRFVSTFINKIDAKGRVSIPAPFRAILERDGYAGGYVISNSQELGDGLAMKQTLVIGPDRATPTEIDLTGTMAAMEAVRVCQAEMSN